MKKNKIKTEKKSALTPLLSIILLATVILCSCGGGAQQPHHETTTQRSAQTDSPPETSESPSKIIITPSDDTTPGFYSDYTFRVLEKKGAADSLASDEMSDAIAAVKKMTGAVIASEASVTPVDDIAASEMSGKPAYDALNLPLDDLASLLRAGQLENLAALGLSPTLDGLSRIPAESLAVSGKYYIAFGDFSPSSIYSAYVLKCNISAALSNEIYAIFGKDIRRAALDGELTLEKILLTLADAELITSSTSTDTVFCLSSDDTLFAPHALITALGGDVIRLYGSEASIGVSDAEFASAYGNAQKIIAGSGADGSAVFTVERFSAVSDTECCLPMPKIGKDDEYRCLAVPSGANGWAVPRGTESGKRTTDITAALAESSRTACDSRLRAVTTDNTAFLVARLIFASRVSRISDFYDWGDFLQPIADGVSSGTPLSSILEDSNYEKKAAAAIAAIKIFTERLS